jgi:hypothetical protein
MLRRARRRGMMASVKRLALLLALLPLACADGRPRANPLAAGVTFAGVWDSTWGKLLLQQDGKHVHGTFTGYREGGVSGSHEGDLYKFVWDQRVPRQHGHGYLQISPDGMHLEGRWGYLDDDLAGGRWAADRDTNQ